jgi:peroxisomal membrane protein 4
MNSRVEWKNEILKIIKGARNGFYYGTKVRFMHAIVMALLFSTSNLKKEIRRILKLALIHGSKLALYIFLYKSTLLLLRLTSNRNQNRKLDYFIAGGICGYSVYKNKKDPLDLQMILYLLPRDITGGILNLQLRGLIPKFDFFPIIATISWGLVMYLYKIDPQCLQSSLTKSMDFLYKSSEVVRHWTDFVPFFVPKVIVRFIDTFYLKK